MQTPKLDGQYEIGYGCNNMRINVSHTRMANLFLQSSLMKTCFFSTIAVCIVQICTQKETQQKLLLSVRTVTAASDSKRICHAKSI